MGIRETKQAIKKLKHLTGDFSTDIDKFRAEIEENFACAMLPNRVECVSETINTIECDVFIPEVFSKERVMLYIHGGSFVGGSRAAWRSFCASLANTSCTKIILPKIRLSPQHPFPAALEDVKKVIKTLYSKSENIIIAADGSGAAIALPLVFKIKENFRKKIKELVFFSPWFDLSADSEAIKTPPKKHTDKITSPISLKWSAELYTYSANLTNPEVSPMFAEPAMLASLPPVHIQMGRDELLSKDALCFQDKLRKTGIPCEIDFWDGMIHMFQMADEYLPEAHLAMEKIGKHIKNGQTGNL